MIAGHAVRVAILAYEGVDELDLVSVYTPLSKAAESPAPRFPVLPLLVGTTSRVRGSNGLTFEVACGVAELDAADAVVIPGGAGVHRLHEDAALGAALARVVARQTPLYTICSGVFVLARLGLIEGRHVAVHARKREELTRLGVGEVASGFVRDGHLRSIGGAADESYVKGLEMSYHILEDFCPEAIEYVASRLETRPRLCAASQEQGRVAV